MELDVDGAAFSSGESDDSWSITGPTDLDSLWACARPVLTHYLNDDVDNARFNSLSSAFKDLIMFTDFSGVDLPESALGLLNEAWRWHTGLPTNVRTWRASDILPHCRKVLAQGATASAPLHVFGNIFTYAASGHQEEDYCLALSGNGCVRRGDCCWHEQAARNHRGNGATND